jgi:homocysteine S-methyltransferase
LRHPFNSIVDIKKRPLILDGAMGTLLIERGIKPYRSLWTTISNVTNWELVREVHSEYIEAGAEIITTNTFNSNPLSVKESNFDISSKKLVELAVKAAYEAREDKDVLIAGCNAPAEDCYRQERTIDFAELEYNHKKHIELLWEAGADIIWNETQSHLDEIEIIASFCESNQLPYVVSLYFDAELKLLSGEDVLEAVKILLRKYDNINLSFNCIPPKDLLMLFRKKDINFNHGFYLNCGKSDINTGIINDRITPDEYVNYIKELQTPQTTFIGSCCGSTPEHTLKIKEYLLAQNN